jgi:hypothetical protein
MLRTRRLICWAAWLDQIAKGDVDLQRLAAFMLVALGGRGQAPFHVSVLAQCQMQTKRNGRG